MSVTHATSAGPALVAPAFASAVSGEKLASPGVRLAANDNRAAATQSYLSKVIPWKTLGVLPAWLVGGLPVAGAYATVSGAYHAWNLAGRHFWNLYRVAQNISSIETVLKLSASQEMRSPEAEQLARQQLKTLSSMITDVRQAVEKLYGLPLGFLTPRLLSWTLGQENARFLQEAGQTIEQWRKDGKFAAWREKLIALEQNLAREGNVNTNLQQIRSIQNELLKLKRELEATAIGPLLRSLDSPQNRQKLYSALEGVWSLAKDEWQKTSWREWASIAKKAQPALVAGLDTLRALSKVVLPEIGNYGSPEHVNHKIQEKPAPAAPRKHILKMEAALKKPGLQNWPLHKTFYYCCFKMGHVLSKTMRVKIAQLEDLSADLEKTFNTNWRQHTQDLRMHQVPKGMMEFTQRVGGENGYFNRCIGLLTEGVNSMFEGPEKFDQLVNGISARYKDKIFDLNELTIELYSYKPRSKRYEGQTFLAFKHQGSAIGAVGFGPDSESRSNFLTAPFSEYNTRLINCNHYLGKPRCNYQKLRMTPGIKEHLTLLLKKYAAQSQLDLEFLNRIKTSRTVSFKKGPGFISALGQYDAFNNNSADILRLVLDHVYGKANRRLPQVLSHQPLWDKPSTWFYSSRALWYQLEYQWDHSKEKTALRMPEGPTIAQLMKCSLNAVGFLNPDRGMFVVLPRMIRRLLKEAEHVSREIEDLKKHLVLQGIDASNLDPAKPESALKFLKNMSFNTPKLINLIPEIRAFALGYKAHNDQMIRILKQGLSSIFDQPGVKPEEMLWTDTLISREHETPGRPQARLCIREPLSKRHAPEVFVVFSDDGRSFNRAMGLGVDARKIPNTTGHEVSLGARVKDYRHLTDYEDLINIDLKLNPQQVEELKKQIRRDQNPLVHLGRYDARNNNGLHYLKKKLNNIHVSLEERFKLAGLPIRDQDLQDPVNLCERLYSKYGNETYLPVHNGKVLPQNVKKGLQMMHYCIHSGDFSPRAIHGLAQSLMTILQSWDNMFEEKLPKLLDQLGKAGDPLFELTHKLSELKLTSEGGAPVRAFELLTTQARTLLGQLEQYRKMKAVKIPVNQLQTLRNAILNQGSEVIKLISSVYSGLQSDTQEAKEIRGYLMQLLKHFPKALHALDVGAGYLEKNIQKEMGNIAQEIDGIVQNVSHAHEHHKVHQHFMGIVIK